MISDTAIPLRFQTAEVGVDWLQCNIECQEGCPVNTNCRGYLMLAAEGRFEEGYILARDPNPVAAICGYVCSAPCEKACRRADIDKPLAIRAMKRFLVDWHYGNNMPDNVVVQPPTGRSVAVIGAGPAGLAAAKELGGWGHEVHVYEALPSGGGTTLIGVPAFRLPRDVIELDVNWVAKHGVQFHYNVEIGRDITLEELRERHDAVVVATGCMYPVAMNVPGEELDGVIYGVDFLKRANLGQPQWVGEHVVIIGGGYTAMDSSAPPSPRREDLDDPLPPRPGRDGRRRGGAARDPLRGRAVRVLRLAGRGPRRSRREGQRHGLPAHAPRPPGRERRRSAEPIPGSEFTVPCDMVIPCTSQASGQQRPRRVRREAQPPRRRDRYPQRRRGRLALVVAHRAAERDDAEGPERTADELPDVRVQPRQRRDQRRHLRDDRRRRLRGRRLRHRPGDDHRGGRPRPACGARGRSLAGRACAARSSRSCRSSTAPSSPRASSTTCRASTRRRAARRSRWRRRSCAATSPSLVEVGYDTRGAIAEGTRCLQCNHNINIDGPRCILCGLCADVCPEGVIYMVDKAQVGGDDPEQDFFQAWPRGIAMIIDEERCIRCNLCVERCPTNCITMDRLELERFTPDGKVLLESYKDNVLGQVGQQAGVAVER